MDGPKYFIGYDMAIPLSSIIKHKAGYLCRQIFLVDGTFSLPGGPEGGKWVYVTAVGAGGGGGRSSGGNGGGGAGAGGTLCLYPIWLDEVNPTLTVTVGAGGAGSAVASTAGSDGGSSICGVTVTGGRGGAQVWGGNGNDDVHLGDSTFGNDETASSTIAISQWNDETLNHDQKRLGVPREYNGSSGGGGRTSGGTGYDGNDSVGAGIITAGVERIQLASAFDSNTVAGGQIASNWEGGGGGASCWGKGGQKQGTAGTTNVVIPGYGGGGCGGGGSGTHGQDGGDGWVEVMYWL